MDYRTIFQEALHKKLKEKITAHVFLDINDNDELFVDIQAYCLRYQTRINDFSKKILNGLSTDYAAYEILTEYKKFILRNFFK